MLIDLIERGEYEEEPGRLLVALVSEVLPLTRGR
jgi:hypothetical protein